MKGPIGGKIVWWAGKKTNPNIGMYGETIEGQETNDWTVAQGRGLTPQDIDMARPVAVLGLAVARPLPDYVDPIGETVRVDQGVYQVIGVYAKKGASLGGNQDNFVVIPLTTYFQKYGKSDQSLHIMVKARSQEVMDDAIEQVRVILRTARYVAPARRTISAISRTIRSSSSSTISRSTSAWGFSS